MPVATILLRIAFMAAASFGIYWLAGRVYAAVVPEAQRSSRVSLNDRDCGNIPDGCPRGRRDRGGDFGYEGATAAAASGGHRRCRHGGGLAGLCAVCMDEVATVGFQHRGLVHNCLCRGCWRQLQLRGMAGTCPLCNQGGSVVTVIPT